MLKKKKIVPAIGVLALLTFFTGCHEEKLSTINITVEGSQQEMKFYGWWARTDSSQIVSFSHNGGSYQSDHPAVWIEFPKQAIGSYSEGEVNVELQYWSDVGDLYRSSNRGSCNITITGLDPLTGTFGGTIWSNSGISLTLSGDFTVQKDDYQGVQ